MLNPIVALRYSLPKPNNLEWLWAFAVAHWPPVAAFLGSFLVYLFTLAPTVFGLDSAELSAAAYNLGVPHATGYPLYLLIGKLFTYLPAGDVGYRLNLMSAFFAASTVTVVYLLAFLVSGRVIVSLAAAGALAFSYYFWASAVVAEVYTLHAFLTALTIYLLLKWDRGGNNKLLYAAGFVWGLSFGNHMTTALLAPAFAYLVGLGLWHRRLNWWHVAILAGCFIPTLGVYAYFPWRYLAEAVPYNLIRFNDEGVLVRVDTTTIQGMWWALTARQFDSFFFVYRGLDYVGELGRIGFWVFANFLGFGFVLGNLGILHNYTTDRRRLTFLGLMVSANVLFFASYGARDKYAMLLPTYLVWSVWMAEGAQYLLETVKDYRPGGSPGRLAAALGRGISRLPWEKLMLLLPAAALLVNFSYVDVSSDTLIRDRSARLLTSFESNALVLAWWPDSAPMYYLQQVEKMRPDVWIVDRYTVTPKGEVRLLEQNLPHRPVYIFGHLPTLSFPYSAVFVFKTDVLVHKLKVPHRPNGD